MKIKNLILLLVAFIATSFIFTACQELPLPIGADPKDSVQVPSEEKIDKLPEAFTFRIHTGIYAFDWDANKPRVEYGIFADVYDGNEHNHNLMPAEVKVNGEVIPPYGGVDMGAYYMAKPHEYPSEFVFTLNYLGNDYKGTVKNMPLMEVTNIDNPRKGEGPDNWIYGTAKLNAFGDLVVNYTGSIPGGKIDAALQFSSWKSDMVFPPNTWSHELAIMLTGISDNGTITFSAKDIKAILDKFGYSIEDYLVSFEARRNNDYLEEFNGKKVRICYENHTNISFRVKK